MLIAMPSKGRAGKTKSDKYITQAVAYVPENEVEAYQAAGLPWVVGVPMDVRGITKTRNWILDHTDEQWVVFIDDDLKIAGWIELGETQGKHRKLTETQMIAEWERLFEITEDVGYRIWGLDTAGALRSVYPYRPFIWHTYVTASCMGIINDPANPLRFDESFPVKEDYELCLRCIRDDGGVVGARYLYWVNSHWIDPGGVRDYRSQVMELDAIERLIDMYPGLIRRVTRGGSSYSIELDF